MNKKRIVITGIGVLSPSGIGKDAYWDSLQRGESSIKLITLFDTSDLKVKYGGEIFSFDPKEILGKKGLLDLDRATKLLLCASKFAIEDSLLEITENNTHDIGISIGTTFGSLNSVSSFNHEAYIEGPKYVNPSKFPNTVVNSPASRVAIKYNIKGFNTTISTGMCSFLDALEYAVNFINLEKKNTIFVGSVEDLAIQTFLGFYRLRQLSGLDGQMPVSRPFDVKRNGLVFSEASAMFLAEERETALRRKAKQYCEILSLSSVYDASRFYKYNLNGEGLSSAMEQALQEAKLQPKDIDCIFANANSTNDADLVEAKAIEKVFCSSGNDVPVTAIKSMVGETYSTSGGLALAAAIDSLQNNYIPATINTQNIDPNFKLNIVRKKIKKTLNRIMINTSSPDGANTVLIIGR